MIAHRRSWLFVLASLLVRPGFSARAPDTDRIGNDIYRRDGQDASDLFLVGATPMSSGNVAVIVVCVIAGVTFSMALLGWCFMARRAKIPPEDEEGTAGLAEDSQKLKSAFSPDEKHISRRFDRLRKAFAQRKKKRTSYILPVHRGDLPRTPNIGLPPPVVPAPAHHQPGVLDRQPRKVVKRVPPPPIDTSSDSHSSCDSSSSPASEESHESIESTIPLTRPRASPSTHVVPIPGRQLSAFSGAKTALIRTPKSPSRRKSWLSKQPLKHPFVPLRISEASLRFPPGSPMNQYQPARHHLEARLGPQTPRTPRTPRTPPHTPGRSPLAIPWTAGTSRRNSLRRQVLEEEGPTKQARLVGALHSATADGRRTPTGYRGALPPVPASANSRHSQLSSRSLHRDSDPPSSAYI